MMSFIDAKFGVSTDDFLIFLDLAWRKLSYPDSYMNRLALVGKDLSIQLKWDQEDVIKDGMKRVDWLKEVGYIVIIFIIVY